MEREFRRRSRTRLSVLGSRAKLLPHVPALLPLGVFDARDLQLFFFQRSMPVRADIFNARAAEQQHAAPRARLDRHAQPAQAHAAAIPLVPQTKVKQPDESRNQMPMTEV